MSGVASSQDGKPPNSHSAQLYGPGRTITQSPSSCAVRIKVARSRLPEKSYSLVRGSCMFQKRVHAQRVQPHGPHLLQAIAPVLARNARVMHFARADDERLAIEDETIALH